MDKFWGWFYLIISIFMLILIAFLFRKYRNYIKTYLNKKLVRFVIFPIFSVNILIFFAESVSILFYNKTFFPEISTKIWAIFILFFITFMIIHNLKLYLNFGKIPKEIKERTQFGPYIIYGKDPKTELRIIWGNRSRSKSYNILEEKFLLGLKKNKLIESKAKIYINKYTRYLILKNLKPNTGYYYKIPTSTKIFHFKTAPILNLTSDDKISDPEFEFVSVSDFHGNESKLEPIIDLIKKKNSDNIKFIINSGDNVSNGKKIAHWCTFWNQMEKICPYIPFMSCPGNHDGEFIAHAKKWREIFPYPYPNIDSGFYYSFKYLNTVFFFLDIYNAGKQFRIPKKEQIDWLKSEMEHFRKAKYQHRILILHNAIYSTGEFGCDRELEKILLPIIKKYNIQIVISGHSHIFEAFHRTGINKPNGTVFLVNGGGGGHLDTILLKKFNYPTTPYKWTGKIFIAKNQSILKGNPKNRFRIDKIVSEFQEFGILAHHILKFKVKGKEIKIIGIGCNGKIFYEKTLKS